MKIEKAAIILRWGLEGGGEEVLGRKDSENNWVGFWVEGSSFGLDDNDDEVYNSWKTDEVNSIKEALNLLYEDWWQFVVMDIHTEFKTLIYEYIMKKTKNSKINNPQFKLNTDYCDDSGSKESTKSEGSSQPSLFES